MSDETMVERVARAIGKTYSRQAQTFDGWLPHARAAIAAMREPTEGMIKAARDPRTANGSPVSKGVHDTWQAMIDAALAEKEP